MLSVKLMGRKMTYEWQHASHVIEWRLWLSRLGLERIVWPLEATCASRYLDGEEEREGLWR